MKKVYTLKKILSIVALALCFNAKAQFTSVTNQTANQLVQTLVGGGITYSNATLVCGPNANAKFTNINTTLVGIDSGIVLTSGTAVNIGSPAGTFLSAVTGTGGDAQLQVLAGGATMNDVCKLEFDFIPAGDSIKFEYVFASEEYPSFWCSGFADVFGFFINGPGITGTPNIALVPGTTIPVGVNTVNGSTNPGTPCTQYGPGSPFTQYYINNQASTTIAYNGMTHKFTALAQVIPCSTYHLKLAICDGGDSSYDSGVFLKQGSLFSTPITVNPQGGSLNGINSLTVPHPYAVRNCLSGTFKFTRQQATPLPHTINYIIGGSAINGSDYLLIPNSVTIPPNQTQATVVINPVSPPTGTDSVVLYILNSYNCGVNNIIDSVKLWIYDSLQAHILTNDTTICAGQSKQLLAYGDPLFNYSWAPPTYLNNPNIKNPIATPPSTITYVLTASLPGSSCPPVHDVVTITIPELTNPPTSNGPICVGQTLNLYAPTGLPPGTTYNWSGPGGWTSNLQNPTRANSTLAFAGTYTLTVTSNGCSFAPVTVNVVVNPMPTAAPSSNSPVCVGQPINLFSNGVGTGLTYAWTGPGGFTSSLADPVITPATPANAGIYFLNVTQNGCTTTGLFTFVVIGNAPPTPIANSNSPICAGQPINLTANTVPNATYSWTGPGGYTSNLQNPTINPSTVADAGTYSVTVTTTGCASLPGTTTVVVTPSPVITNATFTNPTGCNSNTGSITFNITPNGSYNVTYQKNSVNQSGTYTASGGTLVIPNLGAGSYTNFTLTINGCSVTYPGPITLVDPAAPPIPTAGGNTPICAGQNINLTALTVPGAAYSWTGPGGWSSGVQNPTITGATPAQSGIYTVVADVNGCTSTSTVNILVNPVPATPNASAANTPVCSGSPLNLTGAPSTTGATWSWTGPNSWTSTSQNPTINPATTANSGSYTVTASIGNCVSQPYTFNVTVNPTPSITETHINPSACGLADGSITLNGLTNPGTYTVTYTKNSVAQTPIVGPATAGSITISNLTAGSYGSIIVTLNGCPSNTLGPIVLVDPNAPAAPNASNNGPLCAGQDVTLTVNPAVPGVIYIWTGPNGFTDTSDVTIATNITTTSTFSVVANLNGCSSSPVTTTVVVNPAPTTPTATVNSPLCEGDVMTLTGASTVPGAVYNWSGPNGYNAVGQVQTIPNADPSLDGDYLLYITSPNVPCNSLYDTVQVVVTPTPAPPTVVSPTEICQFEVYPLTAQGQNLLWYTTVTGGTGVSTMNADASIPTQLTYYVSQTINGCEGPRTPITIIVKPQPVPPTVQPNYTYCQYDTTATPLTASGNNLLWYDVATGGSPLPGAPTPNTNIPGTFHYYVTQTDSACESNRADIEVIIHPQPGLPVVEQVTICQDEPNPVLNAQGQNLLWYDSATGGTGSPTPPTTSTTVVGVFDYYVSQTINGCEGERALIRITVNPKVDAAFTTDKDSVCDSYPLLITFSGIAPTGATYDWSFDDATEVDGSGAGPYNVTWETAGVKTITLTVTNLNCTSTFSKTITVLPTPKPIFNIQPDACLNEQIKVQVGWGQMDLPGYDWNFGDAIVSDGTPGTYGPFTLEWNTTGVKVISLSLTNIPCPSLPTFDTINIHHPVAKVMSQSTGDICTSDSVMFTAQPGLDYQYEWLPVSFFGESSNSLSMWGVVRREGFVTLNVTDRWGCEASDSVLVQPKSCCEVFIPNTFTPNGDGKNDVFRMVTQGNHEISVFIIMDRWGKRVFESINQYEPWDGTFNGEPQDMGTYQYYLKFRCAGTQEIVEMKGDVILLR